MKFRKKPVVIDAFRWTAENPMELQLWFDGHGVGAGPDSYGLADANVFIKTLEGTMLASPGDWIIRGVKGEFYPCKPDIFAATYEAVREGEKLLNPRPAFDADHAVARALSLVDMGGQYWLGTGDYRPQIAGMGSPIDLPWTTNNGGTGSDCCGVAINWCYGIPRHRPGFNHRSAGDFDVQDDINCNSAIGDADTDRDLFERVDTPAPGVLLTWPTIHLPGHAYPFVGHVGIVTSVARCAEWDNDAPNYELLDVAQCCGPNGRAPAVIASTGAIWGQHTAMWPKPQHRTVMLRVKP